VSADATTKAPHNTDPNSSILDAMNLYMLYNPMWVMVLPNHALYSLGNEPVSISIHEAIAAIQRDRPDLLILDLKMPVLDGFGVLNYLLDHPGAYLPVIVVSIVTEREERLKALTLGAHEFLPRPFDLDELMVRVKTMLALKEARDSLEQRARDLEEVVAERTSALRLALEELRKTDRYKDEFLSVMSHELRTPLNYIIGSASSLEDGLAGDLNDRQRGMMGNILKGADRLMDLVTDLLDMSLLATGKLTLAPTPWHYEPLVEQAFDGLRSFAKQKGVTLEQDLCVPNPILLDEQRTVQVLTNLLGNALKFTASGGHVVVKAFVRDCQLITEVKDTGVGIAPDDLPKLFKPLKQLDMTSTRTFGGAGLGLSVAKGIVEAHGGEMGVSSVPGVGSTFWFALPAQGHLNASLTP
jgi:signal transduction histidine kinase